MGQASDLLDSLRAGGEATDEDIASLLQSAEPQTRVAPVATPYTGTVGGSSPGNPQGGDTAVSGVSVGRNAPMDITSVLSRGSSNGGSGPSQNMADANAFIRKNRGADGNQVAALLQPQGGVDAVNKNTDKYGVKAEVGPDGQIMLTNVGVTASNPVYPTGPNGRGPGFQTISPNTPTSIQSLLDTLKKADDVDTARGIAAQLRNASAIEQSKYETQAVQFAENQNGVPQLQSELNAAIAADLHDPKYVPGMGDSPYTAKIRTSLETARQQALTNSKVYLNNNADYAVLKASLATADAEVARITRIGDRKDAAEEATQRARDTVQFNRDARSQDIASTLDANQQFRMLTLNPELQQLDKNDQMTQMGRIFENRTKTDKNYAAAVTAPEEALPALALSGNAYANSLVVSKETANTGDSASVVQARLNDMRMIAQNPNFDKLVKAQFGESKEGQKAFKDYADLINNTKLSADGKKQADQIKYQMALNIEKKKQTTNFAGDLTAWKLTPEGSAAADAQFPGASALFSMAVNQNRKVTGKADMIGTFNAYLGETTGPQRIQKAKAFVSLMQDTALQRTHSMFGAPDARALTTQLNAEVTRGAMSRWINATQLENAARVQKAKETGQPVHGYSSDTVGMEGDLLGINAEAPVELDPTAIKY